MIAQYARHASTAQDWQNNRHHILAALLLALCCCPGLATALPGPEQRIDALNGDAGDLYGHAVAVHGRWAVVGAPGDDDAGINAGAAYIYRFSGDAWVAFDKLTAGAGADDFDEFGYAVAVERDLMAVGARWDDDAAFDAGAVYLYAFDGVAWNPLEKLVPTDAVVSAFAFGSAVDIGIAVPEAGSVELTNVLVGAPRADNFQGAVYLFQQTGPFWPALGRFSDSDDSGLLDAGEFGTAVAMRGDAFIAGAPLDDQLGNNSGAAYLYGRTNIIDIWNEVLALYPSAGQAGDRFGQAVAIDANIAVIGAPATNGRPGRVFAVGNTTTELTAGVNGDDFGAAVAVDWQANWLLVGAPHTEFGGPPGAKAGAVHVYRRDALDAWQWQGAVVASDAAINKGFGNAIALRAHDAVIGADESDALTDGAAYLFTERIFIDGLDAP